ncbi:hypothetical protein STEG23_001749, partial [Scotinomys teguina]
LDSIEYSSMREKTHRFTELLKLVYLTSDNIVILKNTTYNIKDIQNLVTGYIKEKGSQKTHAENSQNLGIIVYFENSDTCKYMDMKSNRAGSPAHPHKTQESALVCCPALSKQKLQVFFFPKHYSASASPSSHIDLDSHERLEISGDILKIKINLSQRRLEDYVDPWYTLIAELVIMNLLILQYES